MSATSSAFRSGVTESYCNIATLASRTRSECRETTYRVADDECLVRECVVERASEPLDGTHRPELTLVRRHGPRSTDCREASAS